MSAITGLPGTVFHVLGIQYRYNMTTSLRLAPHLKHGPRILGPPACQFSLNTIECRIRQILQHESKVPGVVHNGRRTLQLLPTVFISDLEPNLWTPRDMLHEMFVYFSPDLDRYIGHRK